MSDQGSYLVVSDSVPEVMAQKVSEKVSDGWKVYGSPFYADLKFHQVVIQSNSPSTENLLDAVEGLEEWIEEEGVVGISPRAKRELVYELAMCVSDDARKKLLPRVETSGT